MPCVSLLKLKTLPGITGHIQHNSRRLRGIGKGKSYEHFTYFIDMIVFNSTEQDRKTIWYFKGKKLPQKYYRLDLLPDENTALITIK